jgi:hypothetical protein
MRTASIAWTTLGLSLALIAAAAPQPARADYYDRYDREQRVARGEQLLWNTLDDFAPYGAAEPAYRRSTIYSWAACLQMCFALAGYETSQRDIIRRTFGDDWGGYNPRSLPQAAYSGVNGSGSRELYFGGSTVPGRLPYQTVIQCIDHGNPVVLVVDPGQGRDGDPLTDYRRGGQRLAIVHGYIWDTDQTTLVRTLWLDVFDPLPPDGATPQSVRVPYNRLAKAWGATLVGTLDNTNYRLGVSQVSR